MKTWAITDEHGRVIAFEVSMISVGLNEIQKILQSNSEVGQLNQRRIFSAASEVHMTFSFRGDIHVVWEPFGDNSRYWIGPKDKLPQSKDIAELEKSFQNYKPTLWKRMLGLLKF